ncbi:MAG: DUF2177 family protein [Nitrosarchaeum sp.]|nr:DUF2177 family protein [Nitrosarchaeum sp.]
MPDAIPRNHKTHHTAMEPLTLLKLFASGLLLIILLDFLWIGVLMSGFYKNQIGSLLLMKDGKLQAKILPAVLVWALLVAGILLFAHPLAGHSTSAALWGALLGIIIYGVYDLTNYALLKGWTLPVVLVDITWGGILCGIVSATLYWLK